MITCAIGEVTTEQISMVPAGNLAAWYEFNDAQNIGKHPRKDAGAPLVCED